jgi:hypothetical protein
MKTEITQLPDASSPLSGNDRIVVVQGGITKDAPVSSLPFTGLVVNNPEIFANYQVLEADRTIFVGTANPVTITIPSGLPVGHELTIQRSIAEVSRGHIVMIPDPLPKLCIILRCDLSLPNHSIVLMLGTGLVIRTVSPLYIFINTVVIYYLPKPVMPPWCVNGSLCCGSGGTSLLWSHRSCPS